jgi:hypothetical protein
MACATYHTEYSRLFPPLHSFKDKIQCQPPLSIRVIMVSCSRYALLDQQKNTNLVLLRLVRYLSPRTSQGISEIQRMLNPSP